MSKYFEPKSMSADELRKKLRAALDEIRPKTKNSGGSMSGVTPAPSPYVYIEDVYPDDGKCIIEVDDSRCYAVAYSVKADGDVSLGKEAIPLKEVYKQDGDPMPVGDIFKKKES